MADKYSVIYDPVAKEPFGIIRQSINAVTAYPVQKSADRWATDYNGGNRIIPYGMTTTDFVEMSCDFVESFKSAFSRGDRVARRANVLSAPKSQYVPEQVVYGTGPAKLAKRGNQMARKVMPVVAHAQKELLRSTLISKAIRNGKRWPKRNKD